MANFYIPSNFTIKNFHVIYESLQPDSSSSITTLILCVCVCVFVRGSGRKLLKSNYSERIPVAGVIEIGRGDVEVDESISNAYLFKKKTKTPRKTMT